MKSNDKRIKDIVGVFLSYCEEKKYQVDPKKNPDGDWRLDISNLKEMGLVLIYHTGKIVIGGKNNDLKKELQQFKTEFENNPSDYLGDNSSSSEFRATRYVIIIDEVKKDIKIKLANIEGDIEFPTELSPSEEYRARLSRGNENLTVTQYKNGTLLLQGKTDSLFEEACTLVEKVGNPDEREVIARFISKDEEYLKVFSAKYTPKLLEMAEENTKRELGEAFDFVEEWDKKWFIASECLSLMKIPLPEYSPYVMPASKAFEGFAKKLLEKLDLVDEGYFEQKGSNFGILNDQKNPKRVKFHDAYKNNDSYLNKLKVCIDLYRHLMMHSDSDDAIKLASPGAATEKINTIYKDTKGIYDYFKSKYSL